jgi:hypothetical protein
MRLSSLQPKLSRQRGSAVISSRRFLGKHNDPDLAVNPVIWIGLGSFSRNGFGSLCFAGMGLVQLVLPKLPFPRFSFSVSSNAHLAPSRSPVGGSTRAFHVAQAVRCRLFLCCVLGLF